MQILKYDLEQPFDEPVVVYANANATIWRRLVDKAYSRFPNAKTGIYEDGTIYLRLRKYEFRLIKN